MYRGHSRNGVKTMIIKSQDLQDHLKGKALVNVHRSRFEEVVHILRDYDVIIYDDVRDKMLMEYGGKFWEVLSEYEPIEIKDLPFVFRMPDREGAKCPDIFELDAWQGEKSYQGDKEANSFFGHPLREFNKRARAYIEKKASDTLAPKGRKIRININRWQDISLQTARHDQRGSLLPQSLIKRATEASIFQNIFNLINEVPTAIVSLNTLLMHPEDYNKYLDVLAHLYHGDFLQLEHSGKTDVLCAYDQIAVTGPLRIKNECNESKDYLEWNFNERPNERDLFTKPKGVYVFKDKTDWASYYPPRKEFKHWYQIPRSVERGSMWGYFLGR